MRMLTLKYGGECRKCGADNKAGMDAVYEKRVGIFCPSCAPTDPEEIRALRQEAADRKADRYDGWAEKRKEKAAALLKPSEHFRDDHAFNTQPGHIPMRARIIAQEERAFESLDKAREMEAKAGRLRHGVRVAGDAERRRQARRNRVLAWLKIGQVVTRNGYQCDGIVQRINKKTATLKAVDGSWMHAVELSYLKLVAEKAGAP